MKFIDIYAKYGYVAQHMEQKLFEYGVFLYGKTSVITALE